ncbi:MAG: xanthine dehydrogenase family protein molybdopterin-binding subunit [Acidobacteria bacterium]|nr:xanthine dehydrogenase family protein molybdopterin-binding subunit [Acidobacteriota bacterium]
MKNTIARREFLTRTGLTLAVAATPSGLRVFAMGEADTDAEVLRPGVWVKLTPDNRITVLMAKSELGQGTHTALAMVVAEELEADWSQVQVETAPVTEEYNDPEVHAQITFGSSSIKNLSEPMRKAGAAGREMLVQAAARRWNVAVSECEASLSKVHHKPSGSSFTYGELCEEAARLPVPTNPRLKKKSEFKIVGTPVPRLDIPAKVNGQAQFGIDVFVPDMLYAAIARPPAFGAQVIAYDEKAARQITGVRHVVKIDRGIAVCADTIDASWKGRDALSVKWNQGIQPHLSTQTVEKELTDGLNRPGVSARNDGDVESALSRAHKQVRAEYFLPYLSHATMETMNCTAHVRSDGCDIWVPTQGQTRALQAATKITGLKPEQIQVHTTYVGGGFGRRALVEHVEEAVQIAKDTGRPIKLVWSREEDIQYGSYRPGNSCRIAGAIDGQGRVTAWSHKVVAPMFFVLPFAPPGVDFAAVSGLINMQYQIPNLSVEYVKLENPIPATFWRSVGNSHNGFTLESFMDELAHAAGKDPLEFRLQHLDHDPRAQRILQTVATQAGWGKPLAEGRARGIACLHAFGSYVAQVAEVSVQEKTGKVQVHRVVCAVDCGPIVNPDTIVAQMEGAITMGLSAALKEKIEFAEGGVKSANFLDYHILRMSEAPDVEVHIVESDGAIGGVGEPGLPPLAPAVSNAVFAATGARIRRLPMTPEVILEAIKKG